MCKFINDNPQIQILQLKSNNLTSEGVSQIFNSLQNSAVIRSVQCSWNHVGIEDQALMSVANFLMQNPSIKYISLSSNNIGAEQIHILANAVKANKTLLGLDLRWNEIGSNGAQILKKAIQGNQTLIYLNLQGNNINNDIIEEIEDIIKRNQRNNPMTPEEIMGYSANEAAGQAGENLEGSQAPNMREEPTRDNGLSQQAQVRDSDGISMVHHLEQVLQQEKLQSAQIRQRLESELDELDRKDK